MYSQSLVITGPVAVTDRHCRDFMNVFARAWSTTSIASRPSLTVSSTIRSRLYSVSSAPSGITMGSGSVSNWTLTESSAKGIVEEFRRGVGIRDKLVGNVKVEVVDRR